MINPIEHPNLPKNSLAVCVSSVKGEALSELIKLGIEVIEPICSAVLGVAEGTHADMSLFHAGETTLFLHESQLLLRERYENLGFECRICSFGGKYPANIALNCAVFANHVFANTKHLDVGVKNFFTAKGQGITHVNQGYARCSTAIISKEAIITGDSGIYCKARACGVDCLLIDDSMIRITGYNHGFIGGSCFMLSSSVLAFCGSLSEIKDKDNIKSFCRDFGVYITELAKEPLTDIGGAVLLCEMA